MSGQLTLGVIGHVDHGKTALVRALTGIETDRLREEQERGLSIVLGFSWLETKHGIVDLIDVPGHEDFVRAMISGATGVDGVILLVAANEGVMPQTREHFDIARLLGVDRGIVVVSKADLVDEEELAATIARIAAFVRGTQLESAPVVVTSANTGLGLGEIRAALEALAMPVERPDGRDFYLPLDRVFTMRGFGLVATGTLRGGRLRSNARVEIMPGGLPATVRALQIHNAGTGEALPGQRVAVNLRNVKREDVRRGNTLASPGFLTPTRRINAELDLLENHDEPLRNSATVRLLIGTTEAMARIRLLDHRTLEPGGTALVQLRCDREIATHAGERFLIRSYSPMRTIGGGRILEVNARRHRRFDESVTSRLRATAGGDPVAILAKLLSEAGTQGVAIDEIGERLGLTEDGLKPVVRALDPVGVDDDRLVERAAFDALTERLVAELEAFHRANPRKRGLTSGSLRSALEDAPAEEVFRQAVAGLTAAGTIESDRGVLRIAGFDPLAGLSDRERRLSGEIERTFLDTGIQPPPPMSVIGGDRGKRKLFQLLLDSGQLVRLRTYERGSNIVLHAAVLQDVERQLRAQYPYPEKFALSEVRDLLDSTRKYVVPVMEHLDAAGVTVRLGNLRRLREP